MELSTIIIMILGFATLAAGIWIAISYSVQSSSKIRSSLMNSNKRAYDDKLSNVDKGFFQAKANLKKSKKTVKKHFTLEDRLFQAGYFSTSQKQFFSKLQIICPIAGIIVLGYLGFWLAGGMWTFVGAIFGGFIGLQFPNSMLDRKILNRGEDIMFFLPLVIEQISIGVSSSLDIGPCLQKVISMSDERDSHNVVTELLRMVLGMAKSGISLEESLNTIGAKSGHLELNQTFGSLAQVVRHGGEISKQLQEMADAVASQRETKIEAKIKKLELEATGPVAFAFVGFLMILFTCIGLQMAKAFG